MRAGFLVGSLNPSVSGGVSGFIPDAGFTFTSSPAYDSPFTVTSAGNIFSATGPTIALFDDFRNAVAGNLPATRAPSLTGSQQWTSGGSPSSPIFARTNAEGTGPAMSHLNNETPGVSGVPFGRIANIIFGQDVTCAYLEYHENWRNSAPAGQAGRNSAGGGGGYYKHNWFMFQATPNYGAISFDCVGPDFLEQSSDATIQAAGTSWAAGTLTITTSNFGSLRIAGTVNWNTWVRGATNTNYNSIAGVQATYISDTSFSIPLAVDPGAYTGTTGVAVIPGGGDLHQSGTASANINTAFAANNSHFGGTKTIAGDSNGIALWDPGASSGNGGWNTNCVAIIGDPSNPTTANTTLKYQLYNALHNQAINYSISAPAIFNSAANYQAMNMLQVVGLLQNTGQKIFDRSTVYLSIGPQATVGFVITDGPTLASSTRYQTCDITSISVGSGTANLRQGRATALPGDYYWYRDAAFNHTRIGQFTPAATFDFYISTTGSDSNPGTLAQPWAITALNTKQATYGGLGKRIGVIGGASSASPVTYNVQSLAASRGSGSDGFAVPVLSVDGGSAANGPTFLAPCNPSGVYTRGAVILTQFSGGIYGNPNNNNTGATARAGNPTIGHKSDVAHRGYVTIDGFNLQGNISACVQIGQFADGVTYTNVLIQNNEVTGNNASAASVEAHDNICGIVIAGAAQGAIVQNNWIHDNVGYAANSLDHFSASLQWQPGLQNIWQFNTYSNSGGLFGKESTQSGNILRYNAIDVSMFTGAAAAIQDFCQGDSSHLIQIYGNIVKGQQGLNLLQTLSNSGVNVAPVNCFGNTIDISGSAGDTMGICLITSGAQSNYNNIIQNSVGGSVGEGLQSIRSAASMTILDYNGYVAAAPNFHIWPGTSGSTNFSGLPAWRTATGLEAHSIASTNAQFTGGTGTLQSKYDLQAGSPFKGQGRVGGVSGGAVIDMGAWGQARSDTTGNPNAQIGCSFAT